ncbi:MAG: PH domain-containing protein [Rudaea sp.]|nr:PH domain-containing protein [Rudaea sp.]
MSADNASRQLALNGSLGRPLFWLVVISAVPFAGLAIALSVAGMHGAGGASHAVFLVPVIFVGGLLFVGLCLSRAGVSVKGGALVINTGFGSKRIALSALRQDSLRVVDLSEKSELRPAWRLRGAGLPGFASGWFRLHNGDTAVCLLLDRSRVCYVRSHDGETLLLSLQHPETLRALLAHPAPG